MSEPTSAQIVAIGDALIKAQDAELATIRAKLEETERECAEQATIISEYVGTAKALADLEEQHRQQAEELARANGLLESVTEWAETMEACKTHPFLNNRCIVEARAHLAANKETTP